MTDQPSDKSFVRGWIEAEKKSHPDCDVVEAISKFTAKDELSEAKLFAALKAMTKPEAEGDT